MPLSVMVRFGWNFLLESGLTYGNPLRGNLRWYFLLFWCVMSIGMYRDWRVSIRAIVLLHRGIMRSLDQRMLCASIPVRLIYLWMPGCVTLVPIEGLSCRWLLLTLVIIGSSMWVSNATLKELSTTMIGHCLCIPQFHIHSDLNIVLLMVWQRLFCWLVPPLVVTRWRNFIHSWRSWQFHSWSRWGLHCFPLFSKRRIRFK